jgi:hypothetical protein
MMKCGILSMVRDNEHEIHNHFLQELYTDELKKMVLLARAKGETIEEIAGRLNVTKERIRQTEAKITRRFAMSQIGRKIRESLIALCASGAVQSTEDPKAYFGEHGAELAHLLRLYKDSFFYNNEFQMDVLF